MDGRFQLPVIVYLQRRFNVQHVDLITEPGPNLILAEQKDCGLVQSIFRRVEISVTKHHSCGIAIVGHEDCVGNQRKREEQIEQLRLAADLLKSRYPALTVVQLWVGLDGVVEELPAGDRTAP